MKAVAFVATYRQGGINDTVADEFLAGAASRGAEVEKVVLRDQQIAYCTNCRRCSSQDGPDPGACMHDDDMAGLIAKGSEADILLFAAPVNFGSITAVGKAFLERLSPLMQMKSGDHYPKMRPPEGRRLAVLVSSSMAPEILAKLYRMTAMDSLETMAGLFNAEVVARVHFGLVGRFRHNDLSARRRRAAYRLGRRLVDAAGGGPGARVVRATAGAAALLEDLPVVGSILDAIRPV